MKRLAMLLVACGLQACAVTATQIHGNDGKSYQYVECKGLFRTLDDCYVKANEVCPAGYQIDNDAAPRDTYNSSMIVRCS
ncbi:MAG TPA: hypothetical protein VFD92_08480 [Candidatus Binatia bacterium]|nr:hypothetical protein [Candidatus Binatia bacterium]